MIDESLDIMRWALASDEAWFIKLPKPSRFGWLRALTRRSSRFWMLIKYHRLSLRIRSNTTASRRPSVSMTLSGSCHTNYLLSAAPQFLDLAVMPFVRQFASVDRRWFDAQPRQRIRQWLDGWLVDPLFTGVMEKFPQWQRKAVRERNGQHRMRRRQPVDKKIGEG